MSQTDWRLVIDPGARRGAMNMAIDQAIMEAVAGDHVPPTLRFYAWEPACLSLGYMQKLADVDQERLAIQGWDLVRRMTGGRAVLHADELTYSVAVKTGHPVVAGDIVESYHRLSGALLNGLAHLGANPAADKQDQQIKRTHSANNPVCFEIPSHYEITVAGKKLVGSAQVRKFGAVLQHGSLPLTGDITRICDALVFPSDEKRNMVRERVRRRAITLENALGSPVTWEQAATAMRASFQDTFDLTLIAADALTPEEQARADELYTAQYASDDWSARF
ncbi:MAG: lipoate--protein ligase family protein [Anaerolineae bacterium]|nr:lipoate--protein ligase family protein [Anaerolineae bacterium]